jgi:hypothetical protein
MVTIMDLETFKEREGIGWRPLAQMLGYRSHIRVRSWALGECRPDADELEQIILRTEGAVTIEAMHRRRLKWLAENRGIKLPDKNGQHVMI